jgi:hypothetical protein
MYSNTKCLAKWCFFSSSSNKFEGYGLLFVSYVIFQQFYDPKMTVSAHDLHWHLSPEGHLIDVSNTLPGFGDKSRNMTCLFLQYFIKM